VKKRTLAALAAIAAALKLTTAVFGSLAPASTLAAIVSQGETTQILLRAELAAPTLTLSPATLLTLAFPAPAAMPQSGSRASAKRLRRADIALPFTVQHRAFVAAQESSPDDPMLFYGDGAAIIAPEGIDNCAPLPADGIVVKNNSGLSFDVAQLLAEPLDVSLADDGPSVLILHTHSSESYTKAAGETFEESDPYRTENKEYNIIAVGAALAESLAAQGISVIHDRSLNDFPSYAGSYGRSLETAKRYLEEYPSISLVIDLHRDAIAAADGSQFKTLADINDDLCSQIMLVVGTNGSGLAHPDWTENMKLALRLQHEMNRSFPTLARPITVAEHRYNQHVTRGALLVEVGATGNTLGESIRAAQYFAEAYANVVTAKTNAP